MGEKLPTIGITLGDPYGIGPEVVAKALADDALRARANYVIFGFSEQFSYAYDLAEASYPWFRDRHENLRAYSRPIMVLDYDELANPPVMERGPSIWGGRASMAFLEDAIDACRRGLLNALVTAPISKQAWRLAGYRYPGHTELLAKKTGARDVAMMFVAPRPGSPIAVHRDWGPLKVVLATIHEPLLAIRDLLTIGNVFSKIELADAALRGFFGLPRPRIAVCGLNPHAGESGRFGDEETRIIEPAIFMASENGIDVTGPYPADTLFHRALGGEFDCVIAMYHDQGLIPVKLLAFDDSVNLTLGLPFVRTSPSHGTAFDIAGRNKANAGSMRAAIALAVDLASRRPVEPPSQKPPRRRK